MAMSAELSIAASWLSTNLQPWVGALPQHPDICARITTPPVARLVATAPPINAIRPTPPR